MQPIGLAVLTAYGILLFAAARDRAEPQPAPEGFRVAYSIEDARRAFLADPESPVRCVRRSREHVVYRLIEAIEFFEEVS